MKTKEVVMRKTIDGPLYEISDLARSLGQHYNTVWARVYYGRTIPEPTVTVGRRHMYSAEDFERILKFLGVEERVCG